jgi:hypothetical protein
MSWLFRWLFFRAKRDVLVVGSEGEPGPVEGENKLPLTMLDRQELV